MAKGLHWRPILFEEEVIGGKKTERIKAADPPLADRKKS
jgi:hypothetical protein